MAKSLLIGNGINRLGHELSWGGLLRHLSSNLQLEFVNSKPFTLLYEEILLSQARTQTENKGLGEFALKKRVADAMRSLTTTEFHRRVMSADVHHFLTTNYDYNLELAIGRHKRSSLDSESKYSVYRRREVSGRFVWHIHGEADAPATITLGYDHYCGYLQKLRTYATAERAGAKGSPFKRGDCAFDQRDDCLYSWLDVFFRDDIHILGLGLDFPEIDLWWAISYKRRLGARGFSVGKTYFHDWGPGEPDERRKAKNSLLMGLGVLVPPVTDGTFESQYDEFLRRELAV